MENREKLRIPGPAVSLALLMLSYLVARGICEIVAVLRYQGYSFVYPQSYFEIAAVCLLTGALVILALRYRHGGDVENWDLLLLVAGANVSFHFFSGLDYFRVVDFYELPELAVALITILTILRFPSIDMWNRSSVARGGTFIFATPLFFFILPVLLNFPGSGSSVLWTAQFRQQIKDLDSNGSLPATGDILGGRVGFQSDSSLKNSNHMDFRNLSVSVGHEHLGFLIISHRRFADFIDLGLLPDEELNKWRELATDPDTGTRLSVNVAPICEKAWQRFQSKKQSGEIDEWIEHPFAGHFLYRRKEPDGYSLNIFGPTDLPRARSYIHYSHPDADSVPYHLLGPFEPCEK